jgi:hypothetical protein
VSYQVPTLILNPVAVALVASALMRKIFAFRKVETREPNYGDWGNSKLAAESNLAKKLLQRLRLGEWRSRPSGSLNIAVTIAYV